MQPRIAQIPTIVFERDRLIAGQKLRNNVEPVFEEAARLALLQANHHAVGRQRARAEAEHDPPAGQMVEQNDALGDP
jgi:hypothetical protein